jgi:protein TonB
LRRQAMFEDATFESMGIIRTRSSRWMAAVTSIEVLMLLTALLIPLLYPQALPQMCCRIVEMTAPQPEPQLPTHPVVRTALPASEMPHGMVLMPTQIPTDILYVDRAEPPEDTGINSAAFDRPTPSANPFGIRSGSGTAIVRPAVSGPVHITSIIAESEIIQKTLPIYPPIAKAAHIEGTVRLAATISKSGTIENLRVSSGPPMLQQAALNAVSSWRYKPFLLDGQPIEVETTVDVIFSLSR